MLTAIILFVNEREYIRHLEKETFVHGIPNKSNWMMVTVASIVPRIQSCYGIPCERSRWAWRTRNRKLNRLQTNQVEHHIVNSSTDWSVLHDCKCKPYMQLIEISLERNNRSGRTIDSFVPDLASQIFLPDRDEDYLCFARTVLETNTSFRNSKIR